MNFHFRLDRRSFSNLIKEDPQTKISNANNFVLRHFSREIFWIRLLRSLFYWFPTKSSKIIGKTFDFHSYEPPSCLPKLRTLNAQDVSSFQNRHTRGDFNEMKIESLTDNFEWFAPKSLKYGSEKLHSENLTWETP